MAGEFLALAEQLGTDHAEVLLVVLVPAVNLPRQLLGEEALPAMPVLLRTLHPLRTEGTLEGLCHVKEVFAQVLHVLGLFVRILPVFREMCVKVWQQFINRCECFNFCYVPRPLAGVNQVGWKHFL